MKQSITLSDVAVANIQALADVVVGQAESLKVTFDKTGADTKIYINSVLIAELNGNDGAFKIGFNSVNYVADNVGDGLDEIFGALQTYVLGEIPDGTITDVKLSNAAGQIKDRVVTVETRLPLIDLTNGDVVPKDAWLYVHFKDQLTAGEISAIEANAPLMAIINSANLKTETISPLQSVYSPTWVLPGWYCSRSTGIQTVNRLHYTPIYVAENTKNYDAYGCYVSVAQASAIITGAIYKNENGIPTEKLYDLPSLSCATTGDKIGLLNIELKKGHYFIGYVVTGSASNPTLSTINSSTPFTCPVSGRLIGALNSGIDKSFGIKDGATITSPATQPDTFTVPTVFGVILLREV